MKASRLFLIITAITLVIIIFYSMDEGGDQEEYHKKIQEKHKETERFMQSSSESPFYEKDFSGLNFYPIDEKYRVVATLVPVENKKVRILSTSDGKEQRYLEYAYADFELQNQKHRLLILEIADMGPFRGKLFLGFADETSANETYGGGRYLDVAKVPGSRTIELDFNLAYNPYCAYGDKYSCPLPPKENILSVAVEAGEKNYK